MSYKDFDEFKRIKEDWDANKKRHRLILGLYFAVTIIVIIIKIAL